MFFTALYTFVCVFIVYFFILRPFLQRKQTLAIDSSKAVLITGCDSGLGLTVANYLHELGFTVICCCISLQSDGCFSLLAKNDRKRMLIVQMDVTSEESVNAAKQSVEKFFDENNIKGLWALINNAGVCIFGEFDWLTINQCERQVKVNLFGTILVTKKFLDSLIKTKGRVINIGSVNGISAYPGVAVYSATKFGVNGFSDALRYELKKLGVKVIMINPGDFARVTKIMDQHKANAEQMWSNMDLRKHKMYDDYFKEYQNKVLANCGLTSPSRIEDTSFLKDIEEAVYGVNPRNNIISATLPCRYFFLFLSILTTNGKHIVLDLLLKYVLRFDAKKYF